MSTPNKYAIELRDKSFNLKKRLEPFVTRAEWEWNAFGGCGRGSLNIDGNYLTHEIEKDDDIRIYLPNPAGGSALLRYRGYVEDTAPSLTAGQEQVRVNCQGYFGWLNRVIIQDDGEDKVYEGQEVSSIVSDILNTFVIPKTSITLGTVQASSVSPDIISFNGYARDAISTLYDLVGNVECGVNENLEFYWYNRVKDFKDRFYVGHDCTKISDRVDFKGMVNEIYFEGGKINDATFKTTGASARSKAKYGLNEAILQNGSIKTKATADIYMKAIFKQKAVPQRQLSISIDNTKKRLESRFPMGAIAVIDKDAYQDGLKYGTTANGGSNVLYGRRVNGGGNKKYGTTPRNQVDRIRYQFTPETYRLDADIQFGNSLAFSQASAAMKQIEDNLNAVRQRSL